MFTPDANLMPTEFQPRVERTMNFNVDPKALVKTTFVNPNNANASSRSTSLVLPGRVGFAQTLSQLQQKSPVNSSTILNPQVPSVAVQEGDTLSNIVKDHMAQLGRPVSNSESLRLSQDVAQANGISNPDRIYPGQRLNLSALSQPQQAVPANVLTQQALQTKRLEATPTLPMLAGQNPILQKTLDRAVEKGFIPAHEQQQVYQKILGMARHYQFAPDDFARLTLMESDGMNPKATNNRCHGIIQFCDGPDRGAATAGFASNPKAILGHSVLQQLDMVEKYFDQNGLKSMGPTNLDDLYLTVLTPAARREKAPNADLNIAGTQAKKLYVNRDPSTFITRNSIVQGLHQHANERLGLYETAKAQAQKLAQTLTRSAPPVQVATNQAQRAQVLRVGAYLNQDYLR
jgi:LysM repeat protein